MKQVVTLLVYVVVLGLVGSQSTLSQDVTCPSVCTCRDKRNSNAGLYKVECANLTISSIGDLDIPTVTTQLSITGCTRLTRLTRNDLSLLVNLDKLNLSGNAINSIENGAFATQELLTKLDLTANKLSSINGSTFAGLSQLKRLFLTNNHVQRIERGSFDFLTHVNRVSLSGNLFETLPEAIFTPMTDLDRIDFDSENMVCDCRLKWIIKWMEDTDVNIPNTKCAGPPSLTNYLIKDLNRELLPCDWPIDVRLFELRPSSNQLVFAGDRMPIDCRVSNDGIKGIYWYRRGRKVITNATSKITVDQNISEQGLITLSLMIDEISTDSAGTWSCIVQTAQGNVTKSINIVVNPAFCAEITVDSEKGKYTWERAGFNSRKEQPCKSGDAGAKAFYSCNSRGEWHNLDVKACKYSNQITEVLQQLSKDDFNMTSNLEMVRKLMTTALITDKMDVVFFARILRKISVSYDLYEKAEIPKMVYNITSLMMNVNSTLLREAERLNGSCTSMVRNLETVANFVLEKKPSLHEFMENIAVDARKWTPSSFKGLTCTADQSSKIKKTYLESNFRCIEQETSHDLTDSQHQNINMMVHIPEEVGGAVPSDRLFRLLVILFRNDQLFQAIRAEANVADKFYVPSSVISASIISRDVKDLSSPVVVALPRFDTPNQPTQPNVKAVYWQEGESRWQTSGCEITDTVQKRNHNLSVMHCDHMTSYTLLQEKRTFQPVIVEQQIFTIMNSQTYVGASFLCLCLLVIIITYTCAYRYINLSRKLKHSLVNTCKSILFLKVIFVLGVQIKHDIGCKVVGMAIHYFSITTIFWMTVTSWNIYRKISGKVHHHTPAAVQTEDGSAPLQPHPMLKFYLFAWGIPVVICGITGAVDINFYSNSEYCFVAWTPGLYAFYGVVGLFILINCILYLCICSTKRDHVKAYMDEMMVLNAEGCLEPQHADDSMSHTGSIKSSIADSEYKPLAQLTGIILFLMLYILMWTSGAFSIALQSKTETENMDVILSSLYMILCIILGIFLIVFYCLARNDTRRTWQMFCCCKTRESADLPPRSSTNINVITHANAHHSLKRDDESCSDSLKDSSANNQSNPLLQIMQYHKQNSMMTHSVAGSQSRGDPSIQGGSEDISAFYNPRQNGVAKRYWEKTRTSRDRGMNHSMLSVPDTSRKHAHSPTNTEPTTQHMSIEIQIKSHSSKHARRHRLGSANSEPADVRNNIYHSMPRSAHKLDMPYRREREPTIGQSKTSSECGTDVTPQFYHYPPEMWQSSVPRSYNHMINKPTSLSPPPPHPPAAYTRQSPYSHAPADSSHQKPSSDALHKQAYVHNYIRSMKESGDNSDDNESKHSHRSRRSNRAARNKYKHRHHLAALDTSRQLSPSELNQSYISLQSEKTARSAHSNRSARSSHRQRGLRPAEVEQRPLLHIPAAPQHTVEEEDRLNINHSSSDNNSSHYACAPIQDAANNKIINNTTDSPSSFITPAAQAAAAQLSHSNMCDAHNQAPLKLTSTQLSIPEERIYENARKIMSYERPVYTNLEELRQQAAAAKLQAKTPEPNKYELPVYENLFSLNEYDTLKKNKHHVNKGLPLSHSPAPDLKSPLGSQSIRSSDSKSPHISGLVNDHVFNDDSSL